jgi:hypothetical protein
MKTAVLTWRLIVFGFAGWTLFGVFFGLQSYLNAVYFGQKISFAQTLAVWLICGYAWMFLTPLVVRVSEKFFITSGRIGKNLLIHFLFGSLLSLAQLSVFIFARLWFLETTKSLFRFRRIFKNCSRARNFLRGGDNRRYNLPSAWKSINSTSGER